MYDLVPHPPGEMGAESPVWERKTQGKREKQAIAMANRMNEALRCRNLPACVAEQCRASAAAHLVFCASCQALMRTNRAQSIVPSASNWGKCNPYAAAQLFTLPQPAASSHTAFCHARAAVALVGKYVTGPSCIPVDPVFRFVPREAVDSPKLGNVSDCPRKEARPSAGTKNQDLLSCMQSWRWQWWRCWRQIDNVCKTCGHVCSCGACEGPTKHDKALDRTRHTHDPRQQQNSTRGQKTRLFACLEGLCLKCAMPKNTQGLWGGAPNAHSSAHDWPENVFLDTWNGYLQCAMPKITQGLWGAALDAPTLT